jgi:hypothetical protein
VEWKLTSFTFDFSATRIASFASSRSAGGGREIEGGGRDVWVRLGRVVWARCRKSTVILVRVR